MNRELIDINKELQEVDHAMDADPLSADPTHLTGAQGEPRQEKWVFSAGTVGGWGNPV
jgi:hypothetical protein